MYELPPDAVFEVPDVCTVNWDDKAWYNWWVCCGSKRIPTPEEKEAERIALWEKLAGCPHPSRCKTDELL